MKVPEEYRTIRSHPDYKVSNYGNLLSFKRDPNGLPMIPTRHNKGYLKIRLDNINYFVHRLVLTTFISPPPTSKAQTRHLDDDPTNNKLNNLRWGTQKENEEDKRYVGTYDRRGNYYTRLASA